MDDKLIKVGDLWFEPFISPEVIEKTVRHIADDINRDYRDKNPLFLVILNGAFRFAGDLARLLKIDCQWQFIQLSSYKGTQSTGRVKVTGELSIPLEGRHIIIVEDIIDTGITMNYFLAQLEVRKPASIALTAVLVKKEAMRFPIRIDYPGIVVPDRFVVGYGLDYANLGRELNGIWHQVNIE